MERIDEWSVLVPGASRRTYACSATVILIYEALTDRAPSDRSELLLEQAPRSR